MIKFNHELAIEIIKIATAFLGLLTLIFSFFKQYNFHGFFRNKYEKRINQLENIVKKTEDKILRKQAKIILKENQFCVLANCEYSLINKKLYNYCLKNSNWLVWNEVKPIRNYFVVVDSELKINYKFQKKLSSWVVLA